MGGSKKAQKAPIKKDSKYKIPSAFNCPLCDAKSSVIIKLHTASKTATVRCRVCNQPNPVFETTFVPHLEKKVDVFFKYFEDIRQQDQVNLIRSGVQTNQTRRVHGLEQLARNRSSEEETAHIFAPNT